MSTNNPNYSAPPAYQGGQPAQQGAPLNLPAYGISFPDAIKRYFTKYATFSGRASKSEFWWSVLFLVIVNFVFHLLSSITNQNGFINILSGLWSLATIVPNFAICFRRLHDANKSGGLIFIPVGIEVAGTVILMVGGGAAIFSLMSAGQLGYTAAATAGSALAGSIGAILFGLVVMIAGGIVLIVFMCLGTDPAGARFDAAPAQGFAGPGQPVGGPVQPFAQQQYQQPQAPSTQYTQQPVQPAAPVNSPQQYPQTTPQQPADPPQQYPNTPQQGQ